MSSLSESDNISTSIFIGVFDDSTVGGESLPDQPRLKYIVRFGDCRIMLSTKAYYALRETLEAIEILDDETTN